MFEASLIPTSPMTRCPYPFMCLEVPTGQRFSCSPLSTHRILGHFARPIFGDQEPYMDLTWSGSWPFIRTGGHVDSALRLVSMWIKGLQQGLEGWCSSYETWSYKRRAQFPAYTRWLTASVTPAPGCLMPSSELQSTRLRRRTHIYMQTNVHTQKWNK